MKKKQISKVEPTLNMDNFKSSGDLPNADAIKDALQLISQPPQAENLPPMTTPQPLVKSSETKNSKKATAKGTIAITVMLNAELYGQAKIKAFNDGITFSNLVNEALTDFLNPNKE